MPWKAKKQLILWGCGFFVLAIAIAIFVRHDSVDANLLAVIAILGGIAIIVNQLPDNGDNGKK